eukprot:g3224.t1
MASLASESGENTPRSGSGENVEEANEPTREGVTRDKAVQPNNSEDGHSINPVEAPNYIARKNAAMAENFDHFDKNYVIAVTGNTVVFSPRAAGEAPDMDMLLNYMILKLDQVVEKSYNLVYCHTGMNWFSRKHFAWLKEAYSILGRKFKKNISKLIIVHPSFIINAAFMFARPFISSKFWKKLHRVSSITMVDAILDCNVQLKVSPIVYKFEGLDEPKEFFGAPLGSQKLNEESGLPVFLENVAAFLLKNDALIVEGIFRIPGNAKGIETYIRRIESRESLKYIYQDMMSAEVPKYSALDHLHIISGTLKAYLRDLPEPLVPYKAYQPLVDLMKRHASSEHATTNEISKEVEVVNDAFEMLREACDELNLKVLTL